MKFRNSIRYEEIATSRQNNDGTRDDVSCTLLMVWEEKKEPGNAQLKNTFSLLPTSFRADSLVALQHGKKWKIYIVSAITDLQVCSRFSASGNTRDCGPSMTSFVTSYPRSAGRQCI